MWAFILQFQPPNLPLFTLKDILLPSCTGSLYITLMLCTGAPLGIHSLEGKECLVLSISIPDCGCFGSRPCQQKGPPSKSAREVRGWEGSCCRAKGLPCSRSFYLAFLLFFLLRQVIWVPKILRSLYPFTFLFMASSLVPGTPVGQLFPRANPYGPRHRTPQLVGNFEALRFVESEEKGKIRQKKAKEEKN